MRTRLRSPYIKILLGVFMLALGIPLYLYFAKPSYADWMDDNYAYRLKIGFTNSGAIAAERRVTVTVNTQTLNSAGKMLSTCYDTRFTDVTGKTLRFQLTGTCTDTATTYDVVLPSINDGYNAFYMYYGNPLATNASQTVSSVTALATTNSSGTEEKGVTAALYLRFDDGSTSTTQDSSQNNNDGAVTEAAIRNDMCVSDKCFFFDGSNDVITVTNTTSIDLDQRLAGGFTISAWVRVNSDGENDVGQIYQKGTNTYLRTTNQGSDGLVDLEASLDLATSDATATVTNGLTLNKWHHVAVTYSDDADDEITVYIDGLQKAVSSNGDGAPATDTNNLLIGGTTTANFNGMIDEFKIYQTEKTAAQVKTLSMQLGSSEGTGTQAGGVDMSYSLSNNLVGYWKFEQTTGNATDSSGNAFTLTTNIVSYPAAKYGYGADFESGLSNSMYITDNDPLSITGDLTLSAWIKPESNTAATQYDIVGKFDGVNESYQLAQYGDEIRLYIGSASNYIETTASNLATATFYHVIATYSAKDQAATIYINGVKQATSTTGTIPSSIGNNGSRFHIGAEDSTGGVTNGYDGIIDEVRVYSRLLNPSEVTTLYEFAPNPIGYWKFDERTGTSAVDSTGNGKTGTLTNSPAWTAGKYGGAVKFTGQSDSKYVTISDTVGSTSLFDMDTGQSITLSVWTYFTSFAGSEAGTIIGKGSTAGTNNNTNYNIQTATSCTTTCKLVYYTNRPGSPSWQEFDSTNNVLELNKWQHIAVTLTFGTGSSIKMYINGVAVPGSWVSGDGNEVAPVTDEPIFIGAADNATAGIQEEMTGLVDEVKIYNYIRTPKQILQDMNAGHPTVGTPVSGPAGHWSFDEGNSTTAYDKSVNANNLTLSTASWTTSGRTGRAWNGTGANWLSRADDADFDFNTGESFSLSTWVRSDSETNPSTDEYIISKETTSAGYALWFNTGGEIVCGIDDDASSFPEDSAGDTASNTDYYDKLWHHVVCVRDTTNGKLNLYIDGRLFDSDSSLSATGDLSNSDSLTIGDRNATNDTDDFTGDIDETKIYRAALSASDVQVEYNQGKSMVLGALSTTADGKTATNSAERSYCVPGDTSTCSPPIAEWKLDENTGTTAYDTSGNGLDGTLTGSPTWASGKFGSAVKFTGASDSKRITVNDTNALDFTTGNSLSISAWTYFTSFDTVTGTIIGKGSTAGTNNTNYNIQTASGCTTTCQLIFYTHVTGDYQEYDTTNSVLELNKWQQVTMTYTFGTGTSMKIYINGVLVPGSWVHGTGNTAPLTSNEQLWIGAADNPTAGVDEEMNGLVDLVRMYNYIRTPAQVAWEYNRGGPVAHYKFDECQGATAYDSSGNSLNGTITPGAGSNTTVGACGSGTSSEMWNDGTSGKFSSALGFDGTDDYVSIADTATLRFDDTANDFSLFAWVKRTTTGTEYILSKEDADNDGWRLMFNASNQVLCSEDATDVTSSSSITDTNWHHIGCTIDRDGNGQVYIDGLANGSAVAMGTDAMATTSTVNIGTRSYTATSYFNGLIDDVRIYQYSLTDQQIKVLYNENSTVRFGP